MGHATEAAPASRCRYRPAARDGQVPAARAAASGRPRRSGPFFDPAGATGRSTTRQTGPMAAPDVPSRAQLSALTHAVDQLIDRVVVGATASDRAPTEAVAAALYDAERALRSARRALDRAERAAP